MGKLRYPRGRGRRRYRRRRRRYMRRRPVIQRGPLFGKFKLVKLRFSQAGQLLVTNTGAEGDKWIVRTFMANACGTPSLSNPGAKPEGFDLIAPLFERVYTLGSRITWTVLPPSNAHSGIGFLEKSTANLDGQLSPGINQVIANKYCRYGFYGAGPGNISKIQLKYNFSTKSWFHVRDVKDVDELGQDINATGNPTAPPARQAYFNMGWANTHATSQQTNNRDYVVVIDYMCLFVGPRNVA